MKLVDWKRAGWSARGLQNAGIQSLDSRSVRFSPIFAVCLFIQSINFVLLKCFCVCFLFSSNRVLCSCLSWFHRSILQWGSIARILDAQDDREWICSQSTSPVSALSLTFSRACSSQSVCCCSVAWFSLRFSRDWLDLAWIRVYVLFLLVLLTPVYRETLSNRWV